MKHSKCSWGGNPPSRSSNQLCVPVGLFEDFHMVQRTTRPVI
ncbi:hypothetical protein FJ934_01495 [Mesorhizobium sp. B2-4-12]|nr:hypothetical protein FJ934_01495 [Mesorhizobium sp. B2-4-12]